MKKRIEYSNGDIYVGDVSKGQPHGKGTYTIPSLGIAFEAVWDKDEGPRFDSMKVDNPTGKRFLFLFDHSHAVYRIAHLKAVFVPEAGEAKYATMHPIFKILYPDDRAIKILDVATDAVAYEVPGLFLKGGQGMNDFIRVGEHKVYEDRFKNGTVFADDYVEYEEDYRLELLLA